jgi:hypothetical protein
VDEKLKKYFSQREDVPPEIRAQTFAMLKEAENRDATQTPSRWIWSVVLFDFLISSAILFALWVLFGQGIIVYAVTIFCGMSLLAAVVAAAVRSFEGRFAWSGSLRE